MMSVGMFKAKYLVRLRGAGEPCMMRDCPRPVIAALVDDEWNTARAICNHHLAPSIAQQEGLRVVMFDERRGDAIQRTRFRLFRRGNGA